MSEKHIAEVSKKDTISRQAAIEIVRVRCARIPTMAIRAMQELKDLPAEEPERKKGHWKPFDLTWGRNIYACSVCGNSCDVPTEMGKLIFDFCPSCGADMREDNETL